MKQKTGRKLFSILLSLALMLGLMPGMSLTAYAADYENIEITSAVFDATSVSTLKDSLDGFCKLSSAEAKSWDPPTKSGNVRLIRDYGEDYIRITIFVDGKYVNDAGISLEQAQAYAECKYYYAKKTVVAVNSVTLSPATVTLTAGGDAVALTAAVAPDNATDKKVVWSVGGTNAGAVKLYTDEACNTEVGTDATGTLIVYAKGESAGSATITCTSNADNTKTASCAVTVKAAQTITASDVTATYGDTGKKIEANTSGDGALSYAIKSGDAVTVDENTGALTIVKAGSAVITVTAAETATYAQATKDVNVTVNTKAMTVSAENVNVTVDGQPHGITVNVTDPASGATVKYGTEEGSYTLDASPTQTEVGEKTVYYQVTADNYTTYTGSAKVTVSDKSTQTITASDVNATYGDTDKKVSATTDGNGTISYAVKDGSADYIDVNTSTGALTIKKVGTATVIVTAAETATYEQATKEVTVTINKANAVAATVTANNRSYDGTDQPLVNVDNSTLVGGEMRYALGDVNGATQPYTTSIPTGTDAGTYYVWYKVVGDENYNDVDAECIEVTIEEEPAKEEPAKEEPKEEPAKDEPKEEPAKEEPKPEEPVILKPEDLDEGELVADNDGLHFYIQDNGDVTCYTANDKEVYRGFACDGTDTYFFQYDGTAMRDRLTYEPEGKYILYFDEQGHEVFNDYAHVKHSIEGEEVDDYCFFDVYGHMYVDVLTWDQTGTKLLYANPYGVLEVGKWFQFSDTVVWADGTPVDEGMAGGYGYAMEDATLMRDQYTYDWEGRLCYMQGNGVALY